MSGSSRSQRLRPAATRPKSVRIAKIVGPLKELLDPVRDPKGARGPGRAGIDPPLAPDAGVESDGAPSAAMSPPVPVRADPWAALTSIGLTSPPRGDEAIGRLRPGTKPPGAPREPVGPFTWPTVGSSVRVTGARTWPTVGPSVRVTGARIWPTVGPSVRVTGARTWPTVGPSVRV